MSRSISKTDAFLSRHGAADLRSERQRPAERRAAVRRPRRLDADGNTRLTGISASFVLALMLLEVVTVVLGAKSVITLHVAAGLVLIGPMFVKLGSVAYRMASYYRCVSEYRRRDKPSAGLRLLGGALAVLVLLLLGSGLVLIAGPSALHSTARSVHVATAYLTVALLIGHLAIHLLPAVRLASADMRPRTAVRGTRSRWLAVLASLALGGVLALLLGGRGRIYLHNYYPGYSSQRSSKSAHPLVAESGRIPAARSTNAAARDEA
jgi:hypothetical protein